MAGPVRIQKRENVVIVTFPELSQSAQDFALPARLAQIVAEFEKDATSQALLIMISGFFELVDHDSDALQVGELCAQLEACPKPVAVHLDGRAFDGGADFLLAAHHRLAASNSHIGWPNIEKGLLPVGGATQRLPRVMGVTWAIDMLATGRLLYAPRAQRSGFFDALIDGDPVGETHEEAGAANGSIVSSRDYAFEYVRNILAEGQGITRASNRRIHLVDGRAYQQAIAKARNDLASERLFAKRRVVDCVEMAGILPFAAGLNYEADARAECRTHPQAVALAHIEKAENRIDPILLSRQGDHMQVEAPMGHAVVQRLGKAIGAATRAVGRSGVDPSTVIQELEAYGFPATKNAANNIAGKHHKEVMRRVLGALVCEAALCVEQGAVQRPSDIDALAVAGLGFPRWQGGPLRAAQSYGLIKLRNHLRQWAEEDPIWAPPPMLEQAIKDARGFDVMNEDEAL